MHHDRHDDDMGCFKRKKAQHIKINRLIMLTHVDLYINHSTTSLTHAGNSTPPHNTHVRMYTDGDRLHYLYLHNAPT